MTLLYATSGIATSNMTYEVHGLVVRTVELSGNDKLLTILTAERGLLTVVSNGSKSLKSRYLAASQLFCYATFLLDARRDRLWVREVELIESFYDLRLDIVATALANYVCEVAGDVTVPEQPDPEILRLALNTLYAITSGKYSFPLIKAAFEFRAAALLGYLPSLSGCADCGATDGDMMLDVMNGGLLCSACHSLMQAQLPRTDDDFSARTSKVLCIMTPAVRAALGYIISCPADRIFSFRIGDEDMRHLSYATEEYLLNHLERGFRTLQFYKEVVKDNV